MKKLFILGLIVALLLFSLPVLAEDGNGTVSGDVPQTNITTPAPTEVPTVEVTTVIPTDTPTPEVTTVPPTETPTPEVTTVAPTETPTPEVTTVEPTETPVVEVTTVEPTETPTPEVTTVEPTETPVVEVTTVEPTEIPTEVPTAEPTTVEPTVTETPPIVPPVVTPPAAVWTDKADYFFFEFVTIYGSGFTPDATVTVTLSTPDGVVSEWNTTSDSTGAFQTEYTTGLGQPDYIVTATDGTITASTAFTDATQTSTSLNPINGVDALNAGGSYPFSGTVSPNGIPSGSVILYYKIKGNGQCNTGAGGYTTAGTADLGSNGVFSNTFTAPSIVDTYCFFAEFQGYGGQNGFQKSSSATQIKDVISTNTPPNVAATNPSSSVNEGQTATNTGTWSDTNSGDTVTLSASVGTVTKFGTNAAGTWSWSYLTTDGPAQSQTVTITANDGNGGVTSATFSLTVNNVAPTATFNFPASVDEGSLITLTLTAPFDPSSVDTAAGFTYQYDFGSGYTATNTFTPTDNGAVAVKGKIIDKDGGFTEYTGSVTVLNVAPTATFNFPASVNEGSLITLTLTAPFDPSSVDTAAGFTYQYDFGSGYTATNTFTPTDNGVVSVKGKITDKDGGFTEYTGSVTVNNVAPTATFNFPASVNEGSLITLTLTAPFDPSSVDTAAGFTYQYDFGSGYTATNTFTPTDNGVVSVKGKITDKDGGFTEYTGSVTVLNVAPTATFNFPASVDEGSLITLTLTAPFDPSSVDTAAGFTYQYDFGSGYTATNTFTPTDNGVVSVKGKITDKDGGFTEYTGSVTVLNVAPTASIVGAPVNSPEGTKISLTSTVSDPSSVDTAAGFTYAWSVTKDTVAYGSGGSGATFDFTPDDNAAYVVTFSTTDKDGGVGTDTKSITVDNVAPTLTISGDATVNEGALYTLELDSSDPGADTIDHWTITWGDGSLPETLSGDPASATHTYADGPNNYEISATATDEDGTYNAGNTVAVAVNNVAPTLTLSGAATVDEGSLYTLTLSSSDPGTDTIASWSINWGDGPAEVLTGNPASATHTYADGPNSYTIAATATDEDGTFNANTQAVTVNNVAPTLVISGAATVNEGSLYTLTLSSSDPGTDTIASWSINWGDGPAEVLTGNPASATHTYADGPNSYTIAATATDEDGTFNANTQAVTVNNVAPIVDAGVDATINEGSTFTSSGSFTDPGADTWTATVNYGDGSGVQTLALTGKTFALSHVYADNAATPYTVTVTVTDKDGGIGTDTAAVTVLNVVPDITVLTLSATTINENEETSLSGTFSDPGTLDTHTVEVNWGDGSTKTIFTLDANVLSFSSINHKYLDDNPTATPQDDYTITVKVTDKDSAIDTDTKTITVKNVAPTVGAVSIPLDPVKVGTPVSVLTTFTDPGTADTHTATWTWEDGTSAGTVTETGGSGSVSGTHTYTQPGIYTISAIVKDDDGGIGTSTVTTAYVVIYDPSGSFVTGGGWINSPAGAYTANPTMTGKANFGFVSKYKKGATVPDGETEFQFTAGNLNFHSSSYEWLVIANLKATYKGVGTINGAGKYGFILSAIDGDKKPDTFRIKIWEFNKGNNPEGMVYDNLINQPDDADPTTTLGGGSIVIHK